MTDLYQLLGVAPEASAREIKSAYRKLAREWHPDVSASPEAHSKFSEISEAYHILSDPKRRAAYDRGEDPYLYDSFTASFIAYVEQVKAKEREFNLQVDEDMAHFRKEMAERRHAVLVVVPLFISAFYVMVAKPAFIQRFSMFGKLIVVMLAAYGLVYLIKNLALVLKRYTYKSPDQYTSVFKEEELPDKPISRKAGLIFLVCGYIVSLGLGYVVSKIIPFPLTKDLSPAAILGGFIYPPITVLIIGSLRRIGGLFDRF
jgi:hypothetical protein